MAKEKEFLHLFPSLCCNIVVLSVEIRCVFLLLAILYSDFNNPQKLTENALYYLSKMKSHLIWGNIGIPYGSAPNNIQDI